MVAAVASQKLARARAGVTNAISIDLEDCFCVNNLSGAIGRDTWDFCGLRVRESTEKILRLFDYVSDPLPVVRRMRGLTRDESIMAFPRFRTWRAPVRKARLARRGCPVYFFAKGRVEGLPREAGYKSWEASRVGKLHCVVAHVGAKPS